MIVYKFDIIDVDGDEHSVDANYYQITDGFACFWREEFLLHSFYKPKIVIRHEAITELNKALVGCIK